MTMTMSSFKKAEQEYWKDHFDLKVNFADVVIPQKPNRGSWCLIIMPKGLTMDPAVEVIRKDFEVITHAKSLDKFVPINARITNKNYAVWVYVGAEPNQKYLGKTTRQTDINISSKLESILITSALLSAQLLAQQKALCRLCIGIRLKRRLAYIGSMLTTIFSGRAAFVRQFMFKLVFFPYRVFRLYEHAVFLYENLRYNWEIWN